MGGLGSGKQRGWTRAEDQGWEGLSVCVFRTLRVSFSQIWRLILKLEGVEETTLMRNCQEPKTVRDALGTDSYRLSALQASANHLGFCQMGVAENWEGKNVIIFQKAEKVAFWKIEMIRLVLILVLSKNVNRSLKSGCVCMTWKESCLPGAKVAVYSPCAEFTKPW